MTIIERIVSELDAKGLKRSDLARHIGKSTGQISMWESRNTNPPSELIPKIADFLKVSTDYILGSEQPTQQTMQNQVDDFTYAMYDETIKDLTDEEKELLLAHVRLFRKTIGK